MRALLTNPFIKWILFVLLCTSAMQIVYILDGGESRCLKEWDSSGPPFGCMPSLIFMVDFFISALAASVLLPLQSLLGRFKVPGTTAWCAALPVLVGVWIAVGRAPHVGELRGAVEGLVQFSLPIVVALLACTGLAKLGSAHRPASMPIDASPR